MNVKRIRMVPFIIVFLMQRCLLWSIDYRLIAYSVKFDSVQSLDFTVNRFLMKSFSTKDMSVVKCCQQVLDIDLYTKCYN